MSDSAERALCLGCGAELTGPHCHMCGQKAQVHRTLGGFLHELLHGVFHFEGKIWRTLGMLAIRPGELTRRYIAGERSRFVSPVALFLFSVVVLFAAFHVIPSGDAGGADAPVEAIDDGTTVAIGSPDDGGRITIERTGWKSWDEAVESMAANPGLALYKLQTNAYKFSWLLIPISVPFVWLLLAWHRRFGPFDHAVFVTYSIAFMSLLVVLVRLLASTGLFPSGSLLVLAIVIAVTHIYVQLKGAYTLSWLSAAWRTAALTAFILPIVLAFFLMLHLIGMLG